MPAFEFRILLIFTFYCGLMLSKSIGQSRTDVGDQTSPKAEINLSVTPSKCKVKTPVSVSFQIKNIGSVPFYIPPFIEDVGRGGFDVTVALPPGGKATKIVRAADYGPGDTSDILQEAAKWIVLRPGEFYGATRPLASFVKVSSGRIRIVVRRNPPRLSDEDKARLGDGLKFPVLLDMIESAPVVLDVVK